MIAATRFINKCTRSANPTIKVVKCLLSLCLLCFLFVSAPIICVRARYLSHYITPLNKAYYNIFSLKLQL